MSSLFLPEKERAGRLAKACKGDGPGHGRVADVKEDALGSGRLEYSVCSLACLRDETGEEKGRAASYKKHRQAQNAAKSEKSGQGWGHFAQSFFPGAMQH